MESKFLKITNKEEWRGLLGRALFKTFFHSLEWEEFLEKEFKWLKFERYLYNNSVLLSLARVGQKLISHPFCEYGGPLLLRGTEKIDGETFKQDLFSEFKNPIKVSFHPRLLLDFNETRSDRVSSGKVSYFADGAIDLRKTTRHEIEKAQANNLQIERCHNRKELKIFYDLYIKSVKKHKVPAYPFSFFDYFFTSPSAEIILAKKDNKIIAGGTFLFYDKFVHYFQNAIDEKYKNLGANYLILWAKIRKCLAENKVFDFGGTRIGSPLQVFKKGWRGKEYPIFELKNYSEGSSLRGSKLRDIFGILPPFLIKKLSPYLLRYKL